MTFHCSAGSCGAQILKFVTVDVGDSDKQGDGGVFRNLALYQCLETRSLRVPEDIQFCHTVELHYLTFSLVTKRIPQQPT